MPKMALPLALCLWIVLVIPLVHGCGYDSCPRAYDPNKVYLHIIAHSHDDVGWILTPDGYFGDSVSQLLGSVMDSLSKSPDRRFVEVEMYFFKRWYQRQSAETKAKVHAFVKSGQLSFANAGWSMNDEATTHYNNIIDQLTMGNDFLRREFGECAVAKLSWQIDPFGASREMANLYAMAGFDGHVVNRGTDDLQGEFTWNTSIRHSIFTSHLHGFYIPPEGFFFEDDKNDITDDNKALKAKQIADLSRQWNRQYGETGHVLHPFGHDFVYKNAENWYRNLDKLKEEINKLYPDLQMIYSSPQCYLKAVLDKKPKLAVKSGDFHPYWTGYYSSRPVVKYLDRYVNNLMQAAKQLEVFSGLGNLQALIYEGKNEIGVLQHHDAVTGTSPSDVMLDYRWRQVNAIKALKSALSQGLGKLIQKSQNPKNPTKPFIYTSGNVSSLVEHLGQEAFVTLIYNPLPQPTKSWIRIPITASNSFKLTDFEGKDVPNVSFVPIPDRVRALQGHHEEITHELVFEAQLPALGFTTYFATKEATKLTENRKELEKNQDQDYIMKGKSFQLVVNHITGKPIQIVKNGKTHKLVQSFDYYDGHSSVYEFCPRGPAKSVSSLGPMKVTHSGQYAGYSELTAVVGDWLSQTIRVYEAHDNVELDWVAGPLMEAEHKDIEFITRFETDLQTKKTFYTDSNGRQNMKRIRNEQVKECLNQRQTFTFNYYPATTRAILRDEETKQNELLLVFDRSVGVASQADGQIELLIHRRTFNGKGFDGQDLGIIPDDKDSDGLGMVARGKIRLYFNDLNSDSAVDSERQASRKMFMQKIVALNPLHNVEEYKKEHNLHYTALNSNLPDNIHLLTLENWGPLANNELLVRFENYYQPDDKSKFAVDSNFYIENLFKGIEIEKVEKVNLLGGKPVEVGKNIHTTVQPQEIESFVLKVKRNVTNSDCSFKWKKLDSTKQIPANALQAGHELDNSPLYICRHINEDLVPGKYSQKLGCHLSYGNQEIIYRDADVEILTTDNQNYQWAPRHGGDPFPETAYLAGHKSDGLPLYVGRCANDHGVVVGKIDEVFFYPYGNSEVRDCVDHEILAC